jgi:hypothetical protein
MTTSYDCLSCIPKSYADYNYLDTFFPAPYATPSILRPDNRELATSLVAYHLIDQKFPAIDPHVKWGLKIEPSEEYNLPFKQPFWAYINKKYPIQMIRLVLGWDNQLAMRVVDLGNGYFLHALGMDPITYKETNKDALYLSFLFSIDAKTNDGIKRLVSFVEYASNMPRNPFQKAFYKPFGYEKLNRYSKHLNILGYDQYPGHTTARLEKIYKRMLSGRPTKQLDDGDPYWISDLFSPKDQVPGEWPYPLLS